MSALVSFPDGGFRFLEGVFPYSQGVAALPGFAIERARFARPVPVPEGFRRIKGARDLDHPGLAVLRELYLLREQLAEAADVPPFKIVNNEALLLIAGQRPGNSGALAGIQGVGERLRRRNGPDLLAAVRRGIAGQDEVPMRLPPTGRRPDPEETAIDEGLREWRRDACARDHLTPLAVLPNPVIERIARERPATAGDLAKIEGLGQGRLARYGEEILAVVRNPPPPRRGRWPRRARGGDEP